MDLQQPDAPVLDDVRAPAAAPPVVAVIVTHNPGPWLEETLVAIGAQDYPDLSVLVIDAASDEDPTARVAAQLPGAYVRRLDHNPGFAAACNEVLQVVEGASHFVFLHDDVAPAPDAVRLLVEEAYRSNAGVVAPKLVAWDDPRLLLSVGMTADKAGAGVAFGRHELDQEQHDGVRDVFVAPGGCTLVRADLYAALDGFDPAMVMFGEDLDLSWRAQVAGARVVVAPAARVRHLEATAAGLRPLEFGPDDGALADRVRPLEFRHRLRTVLKCYGFVHLARVLPQLLALGVAESLYALVARRRANVAAVVAAWRWNARRLGDIRSTRRAIQRQRIVGDGGIRRLQARGSARLSGFVRAQLSAEEKTFGVAAAGRELAGTLRRGGLKLGLTVWGVVALVLVIGSRELLAGPLPEVGQMVPFPESPITFLRHFASGWRTTGLGSDSPAPVAFAFLGLAGMAVVGAMGLLQKLLVLGAIPVGIIGMWRLCRPIGGLRTRLVAMTLYAAVPLPYDALARGRWSGLLAYAAMPWLLGRLARASGVAPFGAVAAAEAGLARSARARHRLPPRTTAVDDVASVLGAEAGAMDPIAAEEYLVAQGALLGVPDHEPDPMAEPAPSPSPYRPPRTFQEQLVPAALLLAVVGAFVPAMAAVTVLAAIGLVAGSLLVGDARSGLRSLALAGAAVLGAALLLFPWTLELVRAGSGWAGFAGFGPPPGLAPTLSDLARLDTGPVAGGVLGWAFLVAAALPLIVARRWRFTWAVRLWMVAIASWGLAWAGARGWLGVTPPTTDVLLAPAGVALPLAAALGLAAFQTDLPGYRFGWRQVASVVAAAGAAAAVLPVTVGAIDGRWQTPDSDLADLLGWMPERQADGAFRVLWVGQPEVLPLDGWVLESGLAYGTSENGPPDALELWPGSDEGATRLLAEALGLARDERTTRLGRLLGPMAVRYIVVPTSAAAAREGAPRRPVPAELTRALEAQVDLRLIEVDDAVTVYENAAWAPVRTVLPAGAAEASRASGPDALRGADLAGSPPVLRERQGPVTFSGDLPSPGTVFVSEAASPRWRLEVDGGAVERRRAFGWANAFTVEEPGPARLHYRTSPVRWVALGLQALLWVAAVRLAVSGLRRNRSLAAGEASP